MPAPGRAQLRPVAILCPNNPAIQEFDGRSPTALLLTQCKLLNTSPAN